MFIFALPLFFEMDFVLKVWLRNPPEFAVLFTRLVLIDVLIDCINYQIMILAQATGKIKLYQGVVGGILLLNLPISYFFLKVVHTSQYSDFLVSITMTIIAMIARHFIVKHLTEFSITRFLKKVILPCILVVLVSSMLPFFMKNFMKDCLFKIFIIIIVCV